jgi:hypothetical protein
VYAHVHKSINNSIILSAEMATNGTTTAATTTTTAIVAAADDETTTLAEIIRESMAVRVAVDTIIIPMIAGVAHDEEEEWEVSEDNEEKYDEEEQRQRHELRQYEIDKFNFYRACERNDVMVAKSLLEDPRVNLRIDDVSDSLAWTCDLGHKEMVKHLLKDPRAHPAYEDQMSLRKACRRGYTEIVKLLLEDPRVVPMGLLKENKAFISACKHGHLEIVKLLLLKGVNPAEPDNEALIEICKWPVLKVLKLLVKDPRVDPASQENLAIGWACQMGNIEIVDFLIRISRVRKSVFGPPPRVSNYIPRLWRPSSSKRPIVVAKVLKNYRLKAKVYARYICHEYGILHIDHQVLILSFMFDIEEGHLYKLVQNIPIIESF